MSRLVEILVYSARELAWDSHRTQMDIGGAKGGGETNVDFMIQRVKCCAVIVVGETATGLEELPLLLVLLPSPAQASLIVLAK